jgi:hypothetical protein
VQLSLKMLTGEEPLQEPSAADETLSGPDELEARRRAYKAQAAELEAVRAKFVESGHDLRVAIEELAVSRLFRVAGAAAEVIESREHELSALGPGHLLPPEQLSRKIAATTGYPWRSGPDGKDRLLSSDYYRILYGGIDSDQVIARIDEPNGLVAAIGVRMANEMACLATARDFSLPASARLLFPGVEVTYEPEDDNGFPVPAAREAIEHTIAHLHAHLLGEVLPDGDPEIAHTYALWEGTWRDGRAAVASEAEPESLPWPCAAKEDWWTGDPLPDERVIHHDERYTVRAWMAVVAYLLSDHRFLHE